MTTLIALAALALAPCPTRPAPPTADLITCESLLNELADRDALARFPSPAYVGKQFSSYDRKSVTPTDPVGWFANDDAGQFIRDERHDARTEWVMADMKGPGAIVRLWSPNPHGTIRVYVDGSSTPALEADMAKLLAGELDIKPPLAQALSKGWNFYAPIPYAQSCKVTSDAKDIYYHVNYRTYPAATPVRTFTRGDLSSMGTPAQRVASAWHPDAQSAVAADVTMRNPIDPGAQIATALPDGPRALHRLRIVLEAKDLAQALRSTVLSMQFDNQQTVWCPLGDFFASGVGPNELASRDFTTHLLAPGRIELVSRWPMPYQKSASIGIQNSAANPVIVAVEAWHKPWSWDDRSMHFHATWRREYPIRTKQAGGTCDWNYVTVQGQGVYVGDALSVFNPVKAWWGEGDEKISVDGEAFPSHFGTGTEDYYGYGWCWPEPFVHALHGEVRCDGHPNRPGGKWDNMGYTSLFRTRGLDAIPFTTALNFDMEVWHWAATDVEYAATTYFYAKPGAKANRNPDIAGASAALFPTPVRPAPLSIKGAVECESATIVGKSAGLVAVEQGMGEYDGQWSNEAQLWVQGRKLGDSIELAIPAPNDKPHHLVLHATKSWDYGVIRFSINGKPAGQDVDLFSGTPGKVLASGPIDLGSHTPEGGVFILRAQVVGGNPKAEGTRSFFGLDCVEFVN